MYSSDSAHAAVSLVCSSIGRGSRTARSISAPSPTHAALPGDRARNARVANLMPHAVRGAAAWLPSTRDHAATDALDF